MRVRSQPDIFFAQNYRHVLNILAIRFDKFETMPNLKLISIRLDDETLAMVEKLSRTASYRNRSFIIQRILKAVLTCTDDETLQHIIDSWDPYGDGLVVRAFLPFKTTR